MTARPFDAPFRLDRSRNAATQIFDHLRELITSLALKPGEPLQRNLLSEYYGLSSTPIRDALTRLSDERLVDIYPQQATAVRAIDLHSARQAHFLRLSMELEIVHQLAQQITPQLVSALRSLLAAQEFAMSQGDFESFAQVDIAFHRQLFSAAKVDEIWLWVRQQSGNLDRLRRLHLPIQDKAARVIAEHADIVAAIEAGDGEQAMDAVRRHLSGTLSQVTELRTRYPGYFSG